MLEKVSQYRSDLWVSEEVLELQEMQLGAAKLRAETSIPRASSRLSVPRPLKTKGISSNLLDKKDHSRIPLQRVSEATAKEVPATETVRHYEGERNNFVVISDDELKEAAPRNRTPSKSKNSLTNPRSRPFFLRSGTTWNRTRGACKASALLREALAKSGKVGVAQFVLRNRESLCMLKAQGNGAYAQHHRFGSESGR
jgi:DNA end-binding protein Ku